VLLQGQARVRPVIAELMQLYGSAGRAAVVAE